MNIDKFATDKKKHEDKEELSIDMLKILLEKMILIRQFEVKITEFSKKGIFRGSSHFCTGEEATAVGSCMPLKKHDYILPTHRGHGQELSKGADPRYLMAEIIGRKSGLCKGRGGTLHIFDKENNILGSQAILGAQFPIAVGVGFAIKLQKIIDTTVLCFSGDGTTNNGNFYESLSLASLWELPIIFVCINNHYGMGTKYEYTSPISIVDKGQALKIDSYKVDGNDVISVYKVMTKIINKVKKEIKPALIEMNTYRICGHSINDRHNYRDVEEVEEWMKKDPILLLKEHLKNKKVKISEIQEIEKKINKTISDAAQFAQESPFPNPNEDMTA